MSGADALAVARRFTQIQVGRLEALCRNDLILASKASANVAVNGNRHAQLQELRSQIYYHYDGETFVPGRIDAEGGKPGGMLAMLPSALLLDVNVGGTAGNNEKISLSIALSKELVKLGIPTKLTEKDENSIHNPFPGILANVGALASRDPLLMVGKYRDSAEPTIIKATLTTASQGKPPSWSPTIPTFFLKGFHPPSESERPQSLLDSEYAVTSSRDCRTKFNKAVLVVSADNKGGQTFTTNAQAMTDIDQLCTRDRSDYEKIFQYLAASTVSTILELIAPPQLYAVEPDGSFTLSNNGAKLSVGDYFTINFPIVSNRRNRSRNPVEPTETSRPIGIVKIVSIDAKSSRAVPVTTFMVPPPLGLKLSKISSEDALSALQKSGITAAP